MSTAAAISRAPRPTLGSHADTLQQIALLDPKEAHALHVLAKMVLIRLRARELHLIKIAAKG